MGNLQSLRVNVKFVVSHTGGGYTLASGGAATTLFFVALCIVFLRRGSCMGLNGSEFCRGDNLRGWLYELLRAGVDNNWKSRRRNEKMMILPLHAKSIFEHFYATHKVHFYVFKRASFAFKQSYTRLQRNFVTRNRIKERQV
jgi:hypothetical protein